MTPYVPADLEPVQAALSRSLDAVYREKLAREFVGETVEDWLAVLRLLKAGWTLARIREAMESAVDGTGDEGLRSVVEVAEGRE